MTSQLRLLRGQKTKYNEKFLLISLVLDGILNYKILKLIIVGTISMFNFLLKNKSLFKTLQIVALLLSIVLVSSCAKHEYQNKLDVKQKCNGLVCNLEVVDKNVLLTTDIIGSVEQKVLKTTSLKDLEDSGKYKSNVKWRPKDKEDSEIADNDVVLGQGLPPCENNDCTNTSNPTGIKFSSLGTKIVHVSGTLTKDDGKKEYINKNVSINITVSKSINLHATQQGEQTSLVYHFSIANLEYSGIPSDSLYTWQIDGTYVSSA